MSRYPLTPAPRRLPQGIERRIGTAAMSRRRHAMEDYLPHDYRPVEAVDLQNIAATTGSEVIYSNVWPRDPPNAQSSPVTRPITCGDFTLGRCSADPDAEPFEIAEDVMHTLNISGYVVPQPQGVRTWSETHALRLQRPTEVRVPHSCDLRYTRWEYFDTPRIIPMVAGAGTLVSNIVVPASLPPDRVQLRLHRLANMDEHLQLNVINGSTWIIIRFILPQHIQNDLEELQYLREEGQREQVHRGGARRPRKGLEAEQRSTMLSLAHKRCLQDLPDLHPQTVLTLLKSEHRTVGAICNARGKGQVMEVMAAAYRRAGMSPPPACIVRRRQREAEQEVQQTEDHHQAPDQDQHVPHQQPQQTQ